MNLISIIIPVYNAESTLRKCLDSIKSQTFTNWECILVDDGSKDNSGVICDEYVLTDSRFRVIHQKNQGVALARQAGVEMAIGSYSIHCDPDDYVEPEMLQEMFSALQRQNVDILVADFFVDISGRMPIYSAQKISESTLSSLVKDILSGKIHGSLSNKLLPTDIYKKFGARFFEGLNYCEDALVIMQIADKPLKIGYLNRAFYHYVQHDDSITGHYTVETYNQQLSFVEIVKNILSSEYYNYIRSFEFRSFYEAWSHGLFSGKDAQKMMWKYREQLFKPTYRRRDILVKVLILFRADSLAKRIYA